MIGVRVKPEPFETPDFDAVEPLVDDVFTSTSLVLLATAVDEPTPDTPLGPPTRAPTSSPPFVPAVAASAPALLLVVAGGLGPAAVGLELDLEPLSAGFLAAALSAAVRPEVSTFLTLLLVLFAVIDDVDGFLGAVVFNVVFGTK